jgi:hypothetical protein
MSGGPAFRLVPRPLVGGSRDARLGQRGDRSGLTRRCATAAWKSAVVITVAG